MTFRVPTVLNQTPLQEYNFEGTRIDSQQPTYNAYGYLHPGMRAWPQQQFCWQQGYENQYMTYQYAYGNYYCQAPWSLRGYQNEYNGFQACYNHDGFGDHSRVDSVTGDPISSVLDASSLDHPIGEGSYSEYNSDHSSHQLDVSYQRKDAIGITLAVYIFD